MKVIDNFLLPEEFAPIKEYMMGPEFPWYFNQTVDYDGEITNKFQFVHNFIMIEKGLVSNSMGILSPVLNKLDMKHLLKLKANCNPRGDGKNIGEHHVDNGVPTALTAVYYINTNNGGTEFQSGEFVESVENRIVIFDSTMAHRGVSCTDEKVRVLANINYIPAMVKNTYLMRDRPIPEVAYTSYQPPPGAV